MLGWVLIRNLGTRSVTPATFLTPLLLVAAAALVLLRDIPTDGHDLWLEAAGAGAGVLFGALAASQTRVHRRQDGAAAITAGAAFALVWLVANGGRVASQSGPRTQGHVPPASSPCDTRSAPADAWTAAFVLMALAMVLSRTAPSALAVRTTKVHASTVPGVTGAARPVSA